MTSSQEKMNLLEDLVHWGTPLDDEFLENSRAASQGLIIAQTGCGAENIAHVPLSGGVGIMLSLCIENASKRTIRMNAIRLEMPWFDADFHWIRKRSSKVLNQWGGYTVLGGGTYGFDPSTVLNHRLTQNFIFYPGDAIEGFLLGEGLATVPAQYFDRMKIPMQLVCWEGLHVAYASWLDVGVSREKPPKHVKRPRTKRSPIFSERDTAAASNEAGFVNNARGTN